MLLCVGQSLCGQNLIWCGQNQTLLSCPYIAAPFAGADYFCDRDSIGSSVVVDDTRWAGSYGVDADFIARSHVSVEYISKQEINVG